MKRACRNSKHLPGKYLSHISIMILVGWIKSSTANTKETPRVRFTTAGTL